VRNRQAPLLVLFALLGVALLVRLFQVQVHEHVLWATEASRLVLKGREEPYRRGRILDAAGRVLARDEERRTVDLVYREFRRAHPLGEVAHARSLLEGRPVSLPEACAHLGPWASELVALGPRALAAFTRGEPPLAPAGLDRRQRARRAGDVAYYVRRLLGFDVEDPRERRAWQEIVKLARAEDESRSFLELAAAVRHGDDPGGVLLEEQALAARLERSIERLGVLARWIRPDTPDPLRALIGDLELERRTVEDATAAKLFTEATGFVPGRIEPGTLLECFDHGWISALLGWDAQRLSEWAARVRSRWKAGWRDADCLPRLYGMLAFDPATETGAADFLARLAVAYEPEGALDRALDEGPIPWREVEDLAVFSGLEDLFDVSVPEEARELARAALPIQVPELRADPDDRRLLPPGEGEDSFAARLERAVAKRGRSEVASLVELARELNEIWELRYQETLRRTLDAIRHAAGRAALGPTGGLVLAAGGRDRAAERAEYFLKDFGSRPRALTQGELSYDVVYLLTRFEADFPGLRVRQLSTRARVELAGDDVRPAEKLVGQVLAPALEDELRQRRDATRLRELKAIPSHDEEELEELQRLIGEVRLPNEVKGVAGIEAFLDPELTGTNGWSLARGLSEVFAAESEPLPVREAVDGLDVTLTLDSALQAAAQRCLRAPSADHDDLEWAQNPVGAIVLLARNGDVLAAASEPDDQSILDPLAEGQRQFRIERTLKKPTFQPPGSVFKVFVAAYALDHGLDPTRRVVCGPLEGGGSGYKNLRCWNTAGHGSVDLRSALAQSCNAYFAWLGETLDTDDFSALCADFGFGEPTGVRRPPPWDAGLARRGGLSEDLGGLSRPSNGAELSSSLRSMVANGLGRVEATPMQVARGILSLSLGAKHELRLVRSVGGRECPEGASESLGISRRALDFVRRAMRAVAEEPHGTAYKALNPRQLGFHVAVKTGSADLENRKDREGRPRARKHAWVAGWAPDPDPQLYFVVFEHDTLATSSHGAVFLARELLRQPEVLLWLADHGVDVSGVPAR